MRDTKGLDPVHPASRRRTARQAVALVLLAGLLLVVLEGTSMRAAGRGMEPGWERSVVRAVGAPAGWIAERLPFAAVADQVTGWLSDEEDLGRVDGGFLPPPAGDGDEGTARVDPRAFDPRALGTPPGQRPALRSVLVTGDSMAMPLDAVLARELAGADVRTVRDPHVGTGISKSELVDWGRLAQEQAAEHAAEATFVFLGANEGFPMSADGRQVTCCDAAWAAEYATRVRAMASTYGATGRVYWITLPAPRDRERRQIATVVNAAIRVGLAPYGAQARIVDAAALFTPGGRYRDDLEVDGRRRLVRDADGIHLSQPGAELLARRLLDALGADFALPAT